MQWVLGGDAQFPFATQRLVITLQGAVNGNTTDTGVGNATLSVLSSGGLTDVGRTSQNASIASIVITGSWGDSSQPNFLPQVASDVRMVTGVHALRLVH